MKKMTWSSTLLAVSLCLVVTNDAVAKRKKRVPPVLSKDSRLIVIDRSVSNLTGVLVKTRYSGHRFDPLKVCFAGSEILVLGDSFSLESVINSVQRGSNFSWATGKANYHPVDVIAENPILTFGDECGLSIANNNFIFYVQTEKGRQEISSPLPKTWNKPIRAHRLTASVKDGSMFLYLNRKEIAKATLKGKVKLKPATVYAGGKSTAPKLIATETQVNDARVYSPALSDAEISSPLTRSQSNAILNVDLVQTHKITIAK